MSNMYNTSKFSQKEITNMWHNYATSGKSKYFDEIYKIFSQKIYFAAYKILKDRNKALDVTHDVFVQLIANKERYTQVRNFSSWIYTIIKNNATRRLKKDYLFTMFKGAYMETSYELEIGESFDSERAKILEKGIKQLKGKNYGRIIILELEGKNNKEIADILGKTEKYVRDRKHLAKKELRKIIRVMLNSHISIY